ncbi:UDP-N-acetylmuramate dehydrogenase [Rhodocytophaga aerolata]|uniref:UDP-N-acetylenolpyruvoylglucosamine reductase n=1 Tax=Rhodocytophaga aerolata TaxID=455078 RepID=A0ABT8R6Y9_9BACT|nr:UDP-N-acetylmuramate dehydrogenase [Rhodocytophaga aerolata]MDO1447869.1 UDP-N-acetylmuramate dehydrogenase [Rhodocytophaga aerolata]
MMHIQKNISLKSYNTFGIDATAAYFIEIRTVAELQELLTHSIYKAMPKLILGGGSNLLFTQDFDGLVIKIAIEGIEKINEDAQHVYVQAGAGVVWHQLVLYCIEHAYAGIENLSLIPGTVGAAPMQNIGAYGVEIKEIFDRLEAVHIDTGNIRVFTNEECQFGYRESIFKKELKGQYVITRVTFRLGKVPAFNTSYGAIQDTLKQMNVENLTLRSVSDAVIYIRRSKLPDPAEIGNAGSFFKNPEIPTKQYENLKIHYPQMPGYVTSDKTVKVPAGWLIEQSGWKGKRLGDTGVHKNQALVLVNYGNAKGNEIKALAEEVQKSVLAKFDIQLQPEVNFI